ncbi:hypothetical protein [Pseudonocardia sp.]|uniref:hypothetical protein n=1 Tax=Pseudonocardia sp. TaxID=60912 RepID=UPI003D13188B
MTAPAGDAAPDGVSFRLLGPHEGHVLTSLISAVYGDSYDVRWVYDAHEVAARLAEGRYVSVVAESATGKLLCHMGMSLATTGDLVAHSGQAVTLPAARGHHVFTRTKRFLMDWARGAGLRGMYSEVTAAHPYSERANIAVGAHETGFLLGWIPASVANDAALDARRRRRSAAFFYTKLGDGSARDVYAPERHLPVVTRTLEVCDLRGTPARPPGDAVLRARSTLHVDIEADHAIAILTVTAPGADLGDVVRAERHHLFHRRGVDAVYLDLPLDDPATALVADHLEELGVSYSGIFPNSRADGDVLRMQSLHRVRIAADDVVVASDHGRDLLDYVLADLPADARASPAAR